MSTEVLEFDVKFKLSTGDNLIITIEIYDNLICYFNNELINSYYDMIYIFRSYLQNLEEIGYTSFSCDFYQRAMVGNKEKINIQKDELENFFSDIKSSLVYLHNTEFMESETIKYFKPFVKSLKDHVI